MMTGNLQQDICSLISLKPGIRQIEIISLFVTEKQVTTRKTLLIQLKKLVDGKKIQKHKPSYKIVYYTSMDCETEDDLNKALEFNLGKIEKLVSGTKKKFPAYRYELKQEVVKILGKVIDQTIDCIKDWERIIPLVSIRLMYVDQVRCDIESKLNDSSTPPEISEQVMDTADIIYRKCWELDQDIEKLDKEKHKTRDKTTRAEKDTKITKKKQEQNELSKDLDKINDQLENKKRVSPVIYKIVKKHSK